VSAINPSSEPSHRVFSGGKLDVRLMGMVQIDVPSTTMIENGNAPSTV
jgi:hypothetical protein